MIPQISHIEYHQTIKEDFYYETTEFLSEGEKRIAADLSGCAVHELRETAPTIRYAYRYNSKLLRKTFDRDFVGVMSYMYKEWNNKEWEVSFTPVKYIELTEEDDKMCICGHWIKHCCIWKHEKTGTYILIGNVCIGKISATAYKDMLSCVKKQKEKEAENKRKKELEEQRLRAKQWKEQYDLEIKERDDLIARVEREQDEHLEMVDKFNQLKQRTIDLEKKTMLLSILRKCEVCHNLAINKDAPTHFTKCLSCFKNRD